VLNDIIFIFIKFVYL